MSAELRAITELAFRAVGALLSQQPMPVTHESGWQRAGFPLPIKRQQPDADGTTTQEYRPMAVLEYVQELLSGEIASRLARDRKTAKDSVSPEMHEIEKLIEAFPTKLEVRNS